MNSDPLEGRYDETPYRDREYSQFDVTRLLGMAQLFGLLSEEGAARDVRVLDLGCASGAHLREQAARYPGVRFTGIDFSSNEIVAGRKEIEHCGLTNVELIHADLRQVEIEPAQYDLVLCHGIFSWVPDPVKERIFLLCRQAVKPTGIAAIAYITYPGWKQREALRELLAMRIRNVSDPEERVRESALLLRFLHAGYSAQEANPQAAALKEVVESMQQSSANVFLHDELGDCHDPCYFMQFVEWAEECGLQYLAETDLGTMSTESVASSASTLLAHLAPNFLETQQLIDFVVNRSGRCSLLVRSEVSLNRAIRPESFEHLDFSTSWFDTTPINAPPGTAVRFESMSGKAVAIEDPEMERVLRQLAQAADAPLSLTDLERTEAESATQTSRALLSLVAKGLAEPRYRLEGSAEK